MDAVTFQLNAGSQGEVAGLMAIRGYQRAQGKQRDLCLIPVSAHGTNPARAVLAANYMARRLGQRYKIAYRGAQRLIRPRVHY